MNAAERNMSNKIKSLSTEMLIDVVKNVGVSTAEDLVMDYALTELEERMSESDFCDLCASL